MLKTISNIALIFSLLPLLSSCFKEDERIAPHDRGDKITATIAMTQNYKYQVYYSLNNKLVVATNERTEFDLMFESHPTGVLIRPNTANFAMLAPTGKYQLSEVTSATGLQMRFDPSSGNPDSTVLRNWITISGNDTTYAREVYVFDRGINADGNPLGRVKITFDSLVGRKYYFTYANLNGSGLRQAVVEKQQGRNFAYYSLAKHQQVYPEPPKDSYDLLFTQYTTLLFTNTGEAYPYLVTGVLLNPYETEAVQMIEPDFDAIDFQRATAANYLKKSDVIGFDWKKVLGDVSSGNVYYEPMPEKVYLIRDSRGFYYKLRFIGFYNNQGEKGYPTFEFQKL
ncbi:MAG: HmuY family protein [Bacteroidetes bacterium]|nr:HmuY family protein [Bacteroidota bacterium]